MTASPAVVRTLADLKSHIVVLRQAGERIGLVPTLGALHAGHLALARRALDAGEKAVVSIFVNPTQFGPNEDFNAYPRREDDDLAQLAEVGAHLAWLPSVGEMYPEGFATTVAVGGLTDQLDGPHRPGHFAGVATIVTKLLLQVLPDTAYFGEKDYQQLQVIKRLTRDLDIPVTIVGVPTVREADGLALSSRNAYLSADERQRAAALPRILRETIEQAVSGTLPFATLLQRAREALTEAGFGPIDYVAICDAETLLPVTNLDRPARIFVAARLGRTRLIDNLPVVRQPG